MMHVCTVSPLTLLPFLPLSLNLLLSLMVAAIMTEKESSVAEKNAVAAEKDVLKAENETLTAERDELRMQLVKREAERDELRTQLAEMHRRELSASAAGEC